MKKTTLALLLSTLFAMTACSPNEDAKAASTSTNTTETAAVAQPPENPTAVTIEGDILATVNGHPVPAQNAQVLIEMTQKANPGAEIDINILKDNIITQEILAQEARRLKLDQTENYEIQVDFMAKALLTNLLYQDFIKNNPVTDAEIEKEYNLIKEQLEQSQQAESQEFLARHILVETEDEAKKIIEQFEQGVDFGQLAQEHSIDPGSAKNGGSLGGWTPSTVFVPEFAQALSSMKKGDTSMAPVKTQFGWHIIHVDDTREVDAPKEEMPELDDYIKQQLRDQISSKKFAEYQDKLIQNATVVKSE